MQQLLPEDAAERCWDLTVICANWAGTCQTRAELIERLGESCDVWRGTDGIYALPTDWLGVGTLAPPYTWPRLWPLSHTEEALKCYSDGFSRNTIE
jgi:hypothetical protein